MEINKLRSRLEVIRTQKHLQKQEFASILGITEQKYSNIIHGRYSGSFEEYEQFINILGENEDQKHYIATGEHLPSHTQAPPSTPNCTSEIKMLSNTIKDLSQIISHLIAEMSDLKAELRSIKGVNESQGLVTHTGSKVKVPDH